MSSLLFRILGLVFLVWLVRRLLGFFLGDSRGKRAKGNSEGSSSHMVKDPVCGMYMDSRLAVRLEGTGGESYFCSEECRKKYLHNSSDSRAAGPAA